MSTEMWDLSALDHWYPARQELSQPHSFIPVTACISVLDKAGRWRQQRGQKWWAQESLPYLCIVSHKQQLHILRSLQSFPPHLQQQYKLFPQHSPRNSYKTYLQAIFHQPFTPPHHTSRCDWVTTVSWEMLEALLTLWLGNFTPAAKSPSQFLAMAMESWWPQAPAGILRSSSL